MTTAHQRIIKDRYIALLRSNKQNIKSNLTLILPPKLALCEAHHAPAPASGGDQSADRCRLTSSDTSRRAIPDVLAQQVCVQGAIHVAEGKVIGGGSSINGQAMQLGFPEDFESWAALSNDEWSYDKVLPYFRKSERDLDIQDNYCHGADGPMWGYWHWGRCVPKWWGKGAFLPQG
jgi:choline dehydrogenase-like flavoprotein